MYYSGEREREGDRREICEYLFLLQLNINESISKVSLKTEEEISIMNSI